MKKLLFLCLIIVSGKVLTAQTTVTTNEKGEKITEVKTQTLGKNGYNSNRLLYRGSILYNEGFEMATIRLKGGKPVDAPILFNLYRDELVAKVEGKEVLFTNTDFSMRGHNFIAIKGHYYELLFENNLVKVLKRNNCVMKSNRSRGGLNTGEIYEGEFVRSDEFYFLFSDGKMKEFTIDKASVLEALVKVNANLAFPFSDDTLKINKVEDVIAQLK